MKYSDFLKTKSTRFHKGGVKINIDALNKHLFDWQRDVTEWALYKEQSAIFADCGLGKTPMQLSWAEKVAEQSNGKVLILTPLAVSQQTVKEGEKFGIECKRSQDGSAHRITVTNYEKLHYFNPSDFVGVVCDESSILKNFNGQRRGEITKFMGKMRYRLLCTATAAPNDYIELGTSSEALGAMGYMDVLNYFFKNNMNNCSTKRAWASHGGSPPKFRFKKHAEKSFWRWVCSWAKSFRKPSDLGYKNNGFELPKLKERETVIPISRPLPGKLFAEPALCLKEQREERRATLKERCEKVAEMVDHDKPVVIWCHLNDEGDFLESIIPGSKQVKGGMTDDKKEGTLIDFSTGNLRALITKPKIGAFGLNWQHCSHMTFFPSHSYEQYYQGVRRCWRFGQKNPVTVDIVTSEGELAVLKNLQKKSRAADSMFDNLVKYMNESENIGIANNHENKGAVPEWM